jgi:adenine/guanine/hypoxanthine permease
VIAALIPNIAQWATSQIDNSLGAAGTNAAKVGDAALEGNGVIYGGLLTLGQGAILAGLVFGSIVAFIIDKRFIHAGIFALSGSLLAFVGLIHGEKVAWNANGQVALGYLFVAVVCGLFALGRPEPRAKEADEIELDRLHGEAALEPAQVPVQVPAQEPAPATTEPAATPAPA